MKGLLFRKWKNSLIPIDEVGEGALQEYRDGSVIKLTLSSVRNPEFLSKFFCILRFAFQNLPEQFAFIKSEKQLRTCVNYELARKGCRIAGEFIRFPGRSLPYFIPASISYANMDEETFREYYELFIAELSLWFGYDIDIAYEQERINYE